MLAKPLAIATLLFAASCTQSRLKRYAILDYPAKLRPYLEAAVTAGDIDYDRPPVYLEDSTTVEDLSRLSLAESPILRAIALHAMTERPGMDHQQVYLSHLDDTAVIFIDRGTKEGLKATVADYLVALGRWKSEAARDSVAAEILLHHDNVEVAYGALGYLPPLRQYHDRISQLANRHSDDFDLETSVALYALARYQRKEDIPMIRGLLLQNLYRLNRTCFDLMSQFPDTAWLGILTAYYPNAFYHTIAQHHNYIEPAGYIHTLAAYKTDTCAKILASILQPHPQTRRHNPDKYLKSDILQAVWDNRCPAYSAFLLRHGREIHQMLVSDSLNVMTVQPRPPFTLKRRPTPEPVSW